MIMTISLIPLDPSYMAMASDETSYTTVLWLMEVGRSFCREVTGIGGVSMKWTTFQEAVDPSQWTIGLPLVSRTVGIVIPVQ
jgi:hypothetical protein